MTKELQIVFDWHDQDEPTLIIYDTLGGYFGSASINVRKAFSGKSAVALYAQLTGKTVEAVEKEAGIKIDEVEECQ